MGEFEKADKLYEELRAMGVHVTGSCLTWKGPGGLTGKVSVRRPGDWECTTCDLLVMSKSNKCFKCGARKGGDGGDDRGRRSQSYSRKGRGNGGQDRDDGRDRRDRGGRRSRSPPRKRPP